MSKTAIILLSIFGGFLVLALVIGLWLAGQYNTMVTLNETVDNAWSKVQSDYQRRSDLIPNLVSTVKGFAGQEQTVLLGVTEARSRVGQMNVSKDVLDDPQAFKRFSQAQSELGGALSRLLVVSENYPQLKSDANFLDLQAQLEGTENRIKKSRDDFNNTVQAYNTAIKTFPKVLLAGLFGFNPKQYFEASEGSENAPKVEF
ncbi:MAG: LemA family protein [Bacteroidetes bacterium]|nr:LemA family protein [Bacteroidota bacterium]